MDSNTKSLMVDLFYRTMLARDQLHYAQCFALLTDLRVLQASLLLEL